MNVGSEMICVNCGTHLPSTVEGCSICKLNERVVELENKLKEVMPPERPESSGAHPDRSASDTMGSGAPVTTPRPDCTSATGAPQDPFESTIEKLDLESCRRVACRLHDKLDCVVESLQRTLDSTETDIDKLLEETYDELRAEYDRAEKAEQDLKEFRKGVREAAAALVEHLRLGKL